MKIPGPFSTLATLLLSAAFLTGCGSGGVVATPPSPTNTTTALASSTTTVVSGGAVTFTATVSPSAATGTVTFYDGSTSLGTGTLSSGVAAFSTSGLAIGTHAITATYGGSGTTYNASTSAAVSVAVTTIPTTTVLSASAASVALGSPVTFTAMVGPSAATGSVTFSDGATALGTGTLSGGVATFTTSSLALGAHSITAVYGGATLYAASTSAVSGVTITTIPTTIVLASSTTTTAFGSSITLTGTITPSAAPGSLTFYDGSTALGSGTLTGGVATLSVPTLSVGTHILTAKYAGTATYAASTSNMLSITGTAAVTTTTLASSPTTALAGTTVTFTATVASSAATGTVTFYDGTTSIGTGTLASGVATFSLTTLLVGAHSVTAVYGGDGSYATSTSTAVPVTINLNPTSLTLVGDASTAVAGANVTFTATFTGAGATGSIIFKDGPATIGSGNLGSGVVTLTVSTLGTGVHFITASYAGTATYAASTSNAISVNINKASAPPVTGTYTTGPAISGTVLAGSMPVSGASVQFYVAGTTGNGITGGNLIASPVTTNSNGAFSIAAGYSCPLPTSQAYLVATGGGTTANPNAPFTLLTALGACNTLPGSVVLNEVTTAAAAWALAQFVSPGGSIGATSTNSVGLANAFLIANSLVSVAAGTSPGASFPPATTATSPAPRIYSLANLLNTCSTSNAACLSLFAASNGTQTNLLDTAIYIVQHPAANTASLYTLSRNSSAFTPALTAAPADWTLYTILSGAGLNDPSGVGVMTNGNVWISNYFGGVASQFTALGVPVFANGVHATGLDSSYGIAVDQANNAWIPNDLTGGTITKISADGTTSSNFSGSGMYYPVYAAIDTDGSVWVADNGTATLSHLSSTGAPLSGPNGYQTGLTSFPTALAIDANHNVWTNNQGGETITRLGPDGTGGFLVMKCCTAPTALAIDQRGYVWVTNYLGDSGNGTQNGSISQVSSTGTIISTGYMGGGLFRPEGVAVDGAGNVWVANYAGIGISEFAGSQASTPGAVLSPSYGFGSDGPAPGNFAIAVDASGNIWLPNFHTNNVIRFIGLAAPTKSPVIGPAQAP